MFKLALFKIFEGKLNIRIWTKMKALRTGGTCKLGAGNELETLHLAEVCGVAEHVYVEELRHIAAAPQRVLLTYSMPDIRTFLSKKTISGERVKERRQDTRPKSGPNKKYGAGIYFYHLSNFLWFYYI
jgi:hypothetical protein